MKKGIIWILVVLALVSFVNSQCTEANDDFYNDYQMEISCFNHDVILCTNKVGLRFSSVEYDCTSLDTVLGWISSDLPESYPEQCSISKFPKYKLDQYTYNVPGGEACVDEIIFFLGHYENVLQTKVVATLYEGDEVVASDEFDLTKDCNYNGPVVDNRIHCYSDGKVSLFKVNLNGITVSKIKLEKIWNDPFQLYGIFFINNFAGEICDQVGDEDNDDLADCADPDCEQEYGPVNEEGVLGVCNDYESDCADAYDNDGNGLMDCQESVCEGLPGNWEYGTQTPGKCEPEVETTCDDFYDNDYDGAIDLADPDCGGGCIFFNEHTEECYYYDSDGDWSAPITVDWEEFCDDGLDNDNDGSTDEEDLDCQDNFLDFETDCTDDISNDNDELVDCADPDCDGASCYVDGSACWNEEFCIEESCDDTIDNDGDGHSDCFDVDCSSSSHCKEEKTALIKQFGASDEISSWYGYDTEKNAQEVCLDEFGQGCSSLQSFFVFWWVDSDIDCNTPFSDYPGENLLDALIIKALCYETNCIDEIDNDNDGKVDCADEDCPNINVESSCNNNKDDDCDGSIDCYDWDCNKKTCEENDPSGFCEEEILGDFDLVDVYSISFMSEPKDLYCSHNSYVAGPVAIVGDETQDESEWDILGCCQNLDISTASDVICQENNDCEEYVDYMFVNEFNQDVDGWGETNFKQYACKYEDYEFKGKCEIPLSYIPEEGHEINCNDGQDEDEDNKTDCEDYDCHYKEECCIDSDYTPLNLELNVDDPSYYIKGNVKAWWLSWTDDWMGSAGEEMFGSRTDFCSDSSQNWAKVNSCKGPDCYLRESSCSQFEDKVTIPGLNSYDCPWGCFYGRCLTEEFCGNGIDDNGDNMTDCQDYYCDGENGCEFAKELSCFDSFDNDADNLTDCQDPDCHFWKLGVIETLCNNGNDDNCNGFIDCADDNCNEKACGKQMICSNNVCTDIKGPGQAAFQENIFVQIYSYKDFLEELNKCELKKEAGVCDIVCGTKTCIFADGGRNSCLEEGSTKCTCC